jgi:CHAT domain-containing protein
VERIAAPHPPQDRACAFLRTRPKQAAGVVQSRLDHTDSSEGKIEDWPRVWWCPTGPAGVLPLHAAGRHHRTHLQYTAMGEAAASRDSVAGRVVSSYTLTLTALTRARTRRTPSRPICQLAVGVPDAPGQPHLNAVSTELDVLTRYLPEPDRATHLLGPAATRDAVLRALPIHTWLHVSCHGVQHPIDASRSAFLLHDQPLTLADLAQLDLPDADLAYLAACQTASGDLRLLDESLHLAAAVQMVGYRHILATLWNISDGAAPAMADTIYSYLTHVCPSPDPADRPETTRAAHALHHALTQLRQLFPSEPLLGAPYIHLGP